MKIAVFVSIFPKLSETFVISHIVNLIESGYDVNILAEHDPQEDKVHDDVIKYDLLSRTHYMDMPSNCFMRVVKAGKLFITHFYKNPCAVINSLNIFKYGLFALSLTLFYRTIPFLRKTYNVVHCHFAYNGVFFALLKDIGVPGNFVLQIHGGDMKALMPYMGGEEMYRRMFSLVDAVVCNTNFTKNDCINFGCPAQKINVIPVALKIDKFLYTQKLLLEGEKVRILTVGRLVEKKGHEYAIKALKKLSETFQEFEYYIAGDGPLQEELEDLTAILRLEKHVHFLGAITQTEVIDLYKRSHIFLMPCVTAKDHDQEGQALVLQEAQACGLPILSTYHNGIPEGVLDGKSGFLVPERDVPSLTERLKYLLDHPEEWAKMGRAGRAFVESKYDEKMLIEKLDSIYRNT